MHKIFDYSGQLSLLPVKLAMKLKLPLWNKFVVSVDNALEIVREVVKEMIKIDEANGLIKLFTNEGIRGDDLVRIVADLILAAGDTVGIMKNDTRLANWLSQVSRFFLLQFTDSLYNAMVALPAFDKPWGPGRTVR